MEKLMKIKIGMAVFYMVVFVFTFNMTHGSFVEYSYIESLEAQLNSISSSHDSGMIMEALECVWGNWAN